MLKIIIPVLLIVATAIIFLSRSQPLIRGVADDMLVSPARPAVAFKADATFRLIDAARADVLVPIHNVSGNKASVLLYYALYEHAEKPARLTAMFADSTHQYSWHPSPATPKGYIRKKNLEHNGIVGTAITYVLAHADDPWKDNNESAPWGSFMLVRRWVFQLFLLHFNVIVEYREPIPSTNIPIEDDLFALAEFEKRADAAFSILKQDAKYGTMLPRPQKRLPYPPKHLNRNDLAKYVGEVWDESKS